MITWKPTSESCRYREEDSDPAGSKSLACMKRSVELAEEISQAPLLDTHPKQVEVLMAKFEP